MFSHGFKQIDELAPKSRFHLEYGARALSLSVYYIELFACIKPCLCVCVWGGGGSYFGAVNFLNRQSRSKLRS